jgi:hypothetical protein
MDNHRPLQEASPDGREVWDWASRLSDHTFRLHRIRELSASIRSCESECGSCSKWMTKGCPRERHDNRIGRNVGPSSRDMNCAEFTMSASSAQWLASLRDELAALAKPKE